MQGDYHLVLRGNKWIYSQKGLTPFFFYYIICKDLQQIVKWLLQPTSMGRTICSRKNPKWLLKATTARVLSPHSSMPRPIMVAGQWWASSLDSSLTLLLVTSSSASSDMENSLLEILTYYVIGGALLIGAPGVFFFVVFMSALQNTKGRMVGYKDHKTYGDSSIYENTPSDNSKFYLTLE